MVIHSTKTRPPEKDEILLIADDDGFMVGWGMIEIVRVYYTRSVSKTTGGIGTDGKYWIKRATRTSEFSDPKKGRKMMIAYNKAGSGDTYNTSKPFRYVILPDDLLKTLCGKKTISLKK